MGGPPVSSGAGAKPPELECWPCDLGCHLISPEAFLFQSPGPNCLNRLPYSYSPQLRTQTLTSERQLCLNYWVAISNRKKSEAAEGSPQGSTSLETVKTTHSCSQLTHPPPCLHFRTVSPLSFTDLELGQPSNSTEKAPRV